MTANESTNYERERRFLVSDPTIVSGWPHVLITQAYLWAEAGYAVRVRLIQDYDSGGNLRDIDASHAIKGPRIGDERFEVESRLPDFDVARAIIKLAPMTVVKQRFQVIDQEAWDVDVFLGENEGLIIAEIEGTESRSVRRPEWTSEEITYQSRFNNEELARTPFSKWRTRFLDDDDVWGSS